MEHLLQKSKFSIFHNIFNYMIIQRRQKALLCSKGLTLKAGYWQFCIHFYPLNYCKTLILVFFLFEAIGSKNKNHKNMRQRNTVLMFSYTISNKWALIMSMLVSVSSKSPFEW